MRPLLRTPTVHEVRLHWVRTGGGGIAAHLNHPVHCHLAAPFPHRHVQAAPNPHLPLAPHFHGSPGQAQPRLCTERLPLRTLVTSGHGLQCVHRQIVQHR